MAALALLRQGEIAQADARYDTLPIGKNAVAANQAIRVAILRKINRSQEAEALAVTIDQSQLSPEERALIEKPAETPLEKPVGKPAPDEWNEADEPEDNS